ncbi:MAG: PilZ domain-containing protein [Oscillospiraceae bacterium]
MLLLFGNKIIKTEVLGQNGSLLVSAERNFVFPKNLDSGDDSILIIKGKDLPELDRGTRVVVISYSKAGERIKYAGEISMSHGLQMNVQILKSNSTQVLEERRRFFKIKVNLSGRALFVIRDEDTIRFEEPADIGVNDINVGGIFMTSDYEFKKDDCVCVDIEMMEPYHLNTMAHVLRVQRNDQDEILGYGCSFENLTAAQEDAIGKYINHQQLLQRARQNNNDD